MRHMLALPLLLAFAGCGGDPETNRDPASGGTEPHLANIRQLTFTGENAEAYFSMDDTGLILQSTHGDMKADQIFVLPVEGGEMKMVSNGKGKCTCAYYLPDGKRIVYASTHLAGDEPPPKPDYSKGYVWAVSDTYDLYIANADGSNPERLTTNPRYDAEATVSEDGKWIVFTSHRHGDLDIYKMHPDASEFTRLTTEPGYDGGAFFSPDGSKIVYRCNHPEGKELEDYQALLAGANVRPSTMEIWVMNSDGSNRRQVTKLGGANFGPYWHPDNKRIIFASNHKNPRSRNFDLYLVSEDGTGLEQVTTNDTFDGFPMFSHDGKKLVFASNRNAKVQGDTNIFIADWVK